MRYLAPLIGATVSAAQFITSKPRTNTKLLAATAFAVGTGTIWRLAAEQFSG